MENVLHCSRINKMKFILCVMSMAAIIFLFVGNGKTDASYEPGNIEHTIQCKINLKERRRLVPPSPSGSVPLYVVTPTYRRVEQLAELTRTGQTLLTVPDVTWLLIEDASTCSPHVTALLERLGMKYVHLASAMPVRYRSVAPPPRGVSSRRAALRWLRSSISAGVLYFLDDDNTIDVRLFEEMRRTKKVSMFPVGLVTSYMVSSPIVEHGKVVGFFDGWMAGRKFAVDMAGFAINLSVVLASDGTMPYHAGYEEDKLLRNLGVRMEDLEPLANGCTEVMVWHTKTKKNEPPNMSPHVVSHRGTNIEALIQRMETVAMVTT